MNGNSTTVIQGRYEGACPAGAVPGDMTGPGGMKMNLRNMQGAGGG